MQDRAEKRRINHMLANHGLPSLEAPHGLMEALGRKITDHNHFRSLLIRCEPKERAAMFDALKPHLLFSPKPLDVYIAEAAIMAERKQLPAMNADGTFKEYRPIEFVTFWSTIVKLSLMSEPVFVQAMQYLMRDIPEDKLDEVVFKVHVVTKKDTGEEYLRVSAGLHLDGTNLAMGIQ